MFKDYDNGTIYKIGYYSSLLTGICVILFAISIIFSYFTKTIMFSFFVCLFLSIFYVIMINALYSQAATNRKIFGRISLSFSVIYAVYICLVYYTQLTVVRLGGLSKEVLNIISYTPPGTLFFAIDMLGYTFLALSTFVGAFMFENKGLEGLIKKLFLIHGSLAIPTFIFPMLPIFENQNSGNNDTSGIFALLAWCILFAPICFLVANYFKIKRG